MIFEDLSAFVAVARLESFSKAASRLRVAQSSLSKRVQRLEHRFGTALFHRRSRGIGLTATGSALLARAELLIQGFESIERDIFADLTVPSGPVRIAIPPATSRMLAPMIFEHCRAEHPGLEPIMRTGTSDYIHRWLLEGEADLALMYEPEVGVEFEVRPILREPLHVITARFDVHTQKPIEHPDSYALKDLERLPLLMFRRPHSARVIVDRLCAKYAIEPNVVYELEGMDICLGMVERGLGVAIFGVAGMRGELANDKLCAIPFKSPLMNWNLCLVWPRQRDASPAMTTMRRIVETQLGLLVSDGLWPGARRLNA